MLEGIADGEFNSRELDGMKEFCIIEGCIDICSNGISEGCSKEGENDGIAVGFEEGSPEGFEEGSPEGFDEG
jgi:hypothetical protein